MWPCFLVYVLLVHFLVASAELGFIRFFSLVLSLTKCWSLTFFTVGQSVLQIEWAVGEDFVEIGARKALRMEARRHRLQAVLRKEKFIRQDFL